MITRPACNYSFRVQLPEVAGIVRYERKIRLGDPRHQVSIGLAAQSQPIYMETSVAGLARAYFKMDYFNGARSLRMRNFLK
ncbi:hypothetical protein NXC14_PA00177 (plasmid) [Rhizobium sp. NXC14]|nr:hypothetical protein NXC14_PA00177 [Rhizobium sp. NXC14]